MEQIIGFNVARGAAARLLLMLHGVAISEYDKLINRPDLSSAGEEKEERALVSLLEHGRQ